MRINGGLEELIRINDGSERYNGSQVIYTDLIKKINRSMILIPYKSDIYLNHRSSYGDASLLERPPYIPPTPL